MSNFINIHHSSLIIENTDRALGFYCGVLGMKPCDRADLPFPGAWLTVGDQQIHLLELPNPDPVEGRPEHGGRDRHIAIMVKDIAELADKLVSADVLYTRSKSGRQALFCRDPDGNALEFIQASN